LTGFEKILQRYGVPVTLFPDGQESGITAMALVQPVLDK
jgi:hypothetical protein